MTKIKILALSMLTAISVNTAYAESTLTLGAGVGVIDQPYKGYDAKAYLIPAVSYDGDSFWFRGLGGGYYLWNDAADTLSVMAYWSPMYFKPDDSTDHQLRRLDKRKSTMMAGVSWSHHTSYGFLRTSLAVDVLDNSNGVVGDVAWLYRYVNGGFILTPGIGVEWSSQKQMAYRVVNLRAVAWSGIKRIMAGHLTLRSVQITPLPATGGSTEPHVTAAYLMKLKILPWWTSHGMDCFPPGSLIVSDTGMT